MRKAVLFFIAITVTFCFATFLPRTAYSQGGLKGWFNKQKDKIVGKADSAASRKVDLMLNGKPKENAAATKTDSAAVEKKTPGGRPVNSEIRDEDFVQNTTQPPYDTGSTRIKIAKNLLLQVKGKYPQGYAPKWRFLSYSSPLNFKMENWAYANANTSQAGKELAIGEYDNKAVIRWDAFSLCKCYADIIVKDSFTVITEKPQTFEIKNFRRILNDRSTGEPCTSQFNDATRNGGWGGKITLAANSNGDITMSMVMENYSVETTTKHYDAATHGYPLKVHPSTVSYRFIADNITVENEMSAEKATGIIAAENAAKQRQKDFIAKSKKQVDSLMKLIPKKYTGTECKTCYYNSRGYKVASDTKDYYYVEGGGYAGSKTDYNLNTTSVIQNKCNYKIMFIGIQQLYDEEKGYYYKDVTQTMDANYESSTEQGVFAYAFTSLLGMNSEITLQDQYYINGAYLNSTQWLRVVKAPATK